MIGWHKLLLLNKWHRFRRRRKSEIAFDIAGYVACMFFAGLTVHAGLGLLQSLWAAPIEYSLPAKAAELAALPAPNAQNLAKQIAAQHLFGIATASTPAPPPEPEERTSGPVELAGIVFGGDGMSSRAILGIGNNQRSYRPGEALPTGDVLTEVRANEVILKGAQGRYSLVLRHESNALLAEPPHFATTTDDGITVLDLTGAAPPRSRRATPATVSAVPTLQRLKALRMRLLGGK